MFVIVIEVEVEVEAGVDHLTIGWGLGTGLGRRPDKTGCSSDISKIISKLAGEAG